MRLIATGSLLLPFLALACAQSPRALDGKAEKGTTTILAVTASGETFKGKAASDGTFHVDIPTTLAVTVLALHENGTTQTLKFSPKAGAPRLATQIPNADGTVHLGALSTCDCNGDGTTDETTPSENPLEQTDCDHDGTPDYEDADATETGDATDSGGEGEHDGDTAGEGEHSGDGEHSDDNASEGEQDGDHHDGGGDDGGDGGDGGDTGGDGNNCDHNGDAGEGEGDAGGDPGASAGEGEGEGEGDACVGEQCTPAPHL